MIGSSRKVPVFAFSAPVDMRKSFDALAAIVTETMEHDVLSGAMFLFVSRDRKKARVLFFDGTGLCLYAKRLARGLFAAPWEPGAQATLTLSELALFLEGSVLAGTVSLSPPALQRAPAVTASSFST
jgi:transposase